MGGAKSQETLRTALAKGADKAIHVEVGDKDTVSYLITSIIISFNSSLRLEYMKK